MEVWRAFSCVSRRRVVRQGVDAARPPRANEGAVARVASITGKGGVRSVIGVAGEGTGKLTGRLGPSAPERRQEVYRSLGRRGDGPREPPRGPSSVKTTTERGMMGRRPLLGGKDTRGVWLERPWGHPRGSHCHLWPALARRGPAPSSCAPVVLVGGPRGGGARLEADDGAGYLNRTRTDPGQGGNFSRSRWDTSPGRCVVSVLRPPEADCQHLKAGTRRSAPEGWVGGASCC